MNQATATARAAAARIALYSPARARRASDSAPARHAAAFATPARTLPSFEHDVMLGLALRQKAIPSTWLYDHRGCELFEQITQLDEYYPSRSEARILERCAGAIAAAAGPRAVVVELGSGSSRKTRQLLAALEAPQAYLPIDISEQFLAESVAEWPSMFEGLRVLPIVADFTRIASLPELSLLDADAGHGRRIVFFPGSTIGNFTPDEAVSLLVRIGHAVGPDALLIVGADTTHDPAVLIPAYDDREGVTAAFNKNLLLRINRELGANFSPSAFRHEARFNAGQQRVEMHLVSQYTQRVTVAGFPFQFAMGESIHTENSHKYSLPKFQHLAACAGWTHRQLWMDGHSQFAVHVLEQASAGTSAGGCEQNVRFR